jgi:hypothetical protein
MEERGLERIQGGPHEGGGARGGARGARGGWGGWGGLGGGAKLKTLVLWSRFFFSHRVTGSHGLKEVKKTCTRT